MGTTVTAPAPGQSTDFKPPPVGNHLAICIGVIDLGHQWTMYQGQGKWKPKILFRFELCDELMDDGRPFTISRTFTLSLADTGHLKPFLASWLGPDMISESPFDCATLVGMACMLNVVHTRSETDPNRIWANITAATQLPKRIVAPEPKNDLIHYSTDMGPPPASFPKWLVEKIGQSQEFKGTRPPSSPGNGAAHNPNVPPSSFEPMEDSDSPPF